MKIYLIRHGETEFNRDFGRLIGGRSSQTPLTELGKQQAETTGKNCKIIPTRIYSSPIIRSVETAKLFLGNTDFEIVTELMEQTHGEWEGQPRAEIYDFETKNKINFSGGWYAHETGESLQEAKIRIASWFCKEIKNWKDEDVVFVFAHGIILNLLVQFVVGFDINNAPKLKIGNLEYHFLEYKDSQLVAWKLSQKF